MKIQSPFPETMQDSSMKIKGPFPEMYKKLFSENTGLFWGPVKEPCISAKEPYISAKEPYISTEES